MLLFFTFKAWELYVEGETTSKYLLRQALHFILAVAIFLKSTF